MSKTIKIIILLLLLGTIYTVYKIKTDFSECGDRHVKCQKETKPPLLEGEYEFSIKDTNGEETYIASLNIKNVTPTDFTFDINVATQGGIGEISGQAQTLDTKTARAMVMTCELSFEIISNSPPPIISVKENSSGCLQFHGANVQFEHVFTKKK